MSQIALVTGASSGFGRMIANALAGAVRTAYAFMRSLSSRNAHQAEDRIIAEHGGAGRAGPQCRAHGQWAERGFDAQAAR